MGVRHKLTLIFLLLVVSSILLTISFSILFVRKHLAERRMAAMNAQADRIAEYLSRRGRGLWRNERIALAALFPRGLTIFDAAGVRLYGTAAPGVLREGTSVDETGLVVVRRLPVAAAPAAFVRLFHSRAELDSELAPIRWIIYYAMFLSTAMVCLFGAMFAYLLTRPLVRLTRAAEKIESGQAPDAALDSGRKDELGVLARAIGSLAAKLKEENRRLREMHQKQARFYADITHEIANPIHNLLTTVEVLEMGDARSSKYLAALRSNAERLIRLFQDMLTLARYDSDPDFVQKSRFDLRKVLAEAHAAYLPAAEAKGLTLRYRAAEAPLWVVADERRIAQVMDNLISNAVKYTVSGTVDIEWADAGGWIRVGVKDTGPGVAPEHVARLTDRFYRTDGSRSREGGGTGLGLAVVDSILRAHGASLEIETAPGCGARFSFLLAKG
jgi:signal transduction histidine kinase